MSKYTTEVRFICESLTGHEDSVGYNDVDSVIEDAIPLIFSFDFPIFDEEYRNVLCTKILRHYYTREIGSETYGLWKLRLQTRLNEIMPYYNKLYETELLKYDPLRDVDMTTLNVGRRTGERTDINSGETSTERNSNITHESKDEETRNRKNSSNEIGVTNNTRDNSAEESGEDSDSRTNVFNGDRTSENNETNVNNSKTQGNRDSQNRDMYSDTPQGSLTGVDTNTYLTNFRKILGTDATTETGNSTGVTQSNQNIKDLNTETSDGSKDFSRSRTETDKLSGTNVNKKDEYGQDINSATRTQEESSTGADTSKNNSTAIGKTSNTEDYVLHVFGKSAGANYAKMIKDFRDNLLNIDMDIIRALADLFMLIW